MLFFMDKDTLKLAWILATASLWERQYTPFGTILPIVGSQFPAKYGTGVRATVGAASAAMIRGGYDSRSCRSGDLPDSRNTG
jgi:hypothetical protein